MAAVAGIVGITACVGSTYGAFAAPLVLARVTVCGPGQCTCAPVERHAADRRYGERVAGGDPAFIQRGHRPKLSGIAVTDSAGKRIGAGAAFPDSTAKTTLVLPVTPPLAAGVYSVTWQSYPRTATSPRQFPSSPSSPEAWPTLSLLATTSMDRVHQRRLLLGASFFALYAPGEIRLSLRPIPLRGSQASEPEAFSCWRSPRGCRRPPSAISDPADRSRGRTIWTSRDTGFGRAWCLQFVASLVLLETLVGRTGMADFVLAALVLASEAWIGHAGMGSGFGGDLRRLAMAVHILAAGAWLGGLVPSGRDDRYAGRRAVTSSSLADAVMTLRRFSRMGYVAVALRFSSRALPTRSFSSSRPVLSPSPMRSCSP